ncbi:MAG: hypothetical protein PHX30_05380 [Candidatus Pacebacteria bacterium]|nr:hypothetical protein [Candidatus Paceibacterota bacterium]
MKKLLICALFALSALNANASAISDGAIVKTADNPDVYIVKYNAGKQYKRLVLNPLVFQSYGHLKWENLLTVSQEEMDSFVSSDLVRVDGSTDIYQLSPNGDTGDKYLLTSTQGYDTNSIYTINQTDFNNYTGKGSVGARDFEISPVETSQAEANEMMKADIIKDLEAKQQAELVAALEKQKLEIAAQLKADKEAEALEITQAKLGRQSEMINTINTITTTLDVINPRIEELEKLMKSNRDEYAVTIPWGDRYFQLNNMYMNMEREYNPLVEKHNKLVSVLEDINSYIESNTPVRQESKMYLNSLGINV